MFATSIDDLTVAEFLLASIYYAGWVIMFLVGAAEMNTQDPWYEASLTIVSAVFWPVLLPIAVAKMLWDKYHASADEHQGSDPHHDG